MLFVDTYMACLTAATIFQNLTQHPWYSPTYIISTLCVLRVARARRHPSAVFTSHHDERGAGFYAVGFARAGRGRGGAGAYSSPTTSGGCGSGGGSGSGSGVLGMCAVVTSSGTAVANLLPAAAEADAAGLAMVLLTADRPPELRGCGSNQTIDQVQ